jgi:hypothetical protein
MLSVQAWVSTAALSDCSPVRALSSSFATTSTVPSYTFSESGAKVDLNGFGAG